MEVNDDSISVFHRAFRYLEKIKSLKCKLRWIVLINNHIKLYNKMMKKTNIHSHKFKIQNNINHLKRYKTILQRMVSSKKGGDLRNRRSRRVKWEDVQSTFTGRVRTGVIINLKHIEINEFFVDAIVLIKRRLKNLLKKLNMIKMNTTFCGEFIKKSGDSEILDFKYFKSENFIVDSGCDLDRLLSELILDKILKKLEEFQEKDSGYALHSIISLEVNINKFEMGNGSSYIELPDEIKRRKACINIKNYDNACFAWSIVAGLHPREKNCDRVKSYPYFKNVLSCQDIKFPMSIRDIHKFEKLNNLSVNIFSLQLNKNKFEVVPTRISTQINFDRHFNLLLIQDKYVPENSEIDYDDHDDTPIKYHYVLIKNLSRLVSSKLSKNTKKKYICDLCLNYFLTENNLNEHKKYCMKHDPSLIKFPIDSHIEFKNYVYKQKVPYIIYADFESYLKKHNSSSTTFSKSFKYQEHIPMSVGYYLKCNHDSSQSFYNSYTGENCMKWFNDELEMIANKLNIEIKNIKPMKSYPKNGMSDLCHICERSFTAGDESVIDHDHFTGEIRGQAHKICNLQYKKSFMIPVVFHNLSGYDSHFLIRNFSQFAKISVLPLNKEKYISFTVHLEGHQIKYRFIDSIRFMESSLEKLATYLKPDSFINLYSHFPNLSAKHYKLLTRKGIYPYDYIDSIEKLTETTLPSREKFYNKLNDEDITDEEYSHAQQVWSIFDCKNLLDYSNLYLKTDVLLLADIFEQFRVSCHTTYGLDPAWYYTLPGFTFDCMLKYTSMKLQIIKDIDMILFIEESIRGGISQCSNRYAKANNKYMTTFDSEKLSSYIIYFDVNNLYGWAMSQFLPYDEFEWTNTNIDVIQIPDNAPEGYFLEVDLEYPKHLHDIHSDLPFCPENRVPPGSKLPKLLTTLYDKKKYILHYRNLKQALENGMVLTKIHRVLKFKQSAWLKSYIDLNTELRMKASNDFEKNLYKLMNNAVFGKTMENIRKHRIVKIVNKWEGRYGAKNLISSPHFKGRIIFGENLLAIEMKKVNLIFNKPVYIGSAVLDISKTCLYDFHYNYSLTKFNDSSLLYVDTDSLIYEIRDQDPYQLIKLDCLTHFDTSDYPDSNIYDIPRVNKKVPGLMKDENNGAIMSEFVGLRSKMYSFKIDSNNNITKKAKGIKKGVVKKVISFDDYLNCLFDGQSKIITQRNIISENHRVYSMEQEKVALCRTDTKRFITENHHSLPWGHYKIV
ncbi:uncharacterized protein LOC123321018 [Coccinella septempunctata]|uniref:uncharacterized protein LOC123321018 n=1 Tax=Coccinella septempunctata TaxID=41139 RepID=UPI001D099661|nr:uncharacterized protein LOC123321018 [Coccinella septempunctata]